jgi:hypothetical protein
VKKKKTESTPAKKDEVITPTVVSKSESAYQQAVETMCDLIMNFQATGVVFYHKLGKEVNSVTTRPDKYGSKSVEILSKSLEERNVYLKSASLYDAQNIYKTLTPEQLKMVKEAKFSLRRTLLLCRKNVTDEMRQEIIEDAHKHKDEPTNYDVQAAIDAKLGAVAGSMDDGGEGGGEGGSSSNGNADAGGDADVTDAKKALRRIKNAVRLVETMIKKMDGLDECVALVCGGDSADRIKTAFTDFDVVVTAMDELGTSWNNQQASAKASFEKVKEILKS